MPRRVAEAVVPAELGVDQVDGGAVVRVGTGVKVRRRKVREGEIGVSLEAAVGAVLGLVNHLGDELGGERDYEALGKEKYTSIT